jgi:polysaccharide export outer membrane protein
MKTFSASFSLLLLLSTASAQTTTPVAQAPQTPAPPAGGSAAPAPAPTPAPVAPDYRLVPGDKLRVEVYKDAQVSQSVQIRPDGKITLPLANDIVAAGRTPTELRDAIAEALKSYIATPTVTVIVVETVPPMIYVMGEVNSSGPQPLVGKLDIVQALSAAGGFKDFANTKNIKIRRGTQILKFNYKDAIEGRTAPLLLQPGDTIIVP